LESTGLSFPKAPEGDFFCLRSLLSGIGTWRLISATDALKPAWMKMNGKKELKSRYSLLKYSQNELKRYKSKTHNFGLYFFFLNFLF